jgi:hypothetical protein
MLETCEGPWVFPETTGDCLRTCGTEFTSGLALIKCCSNRTYLEEICTTGEISYYVTRSVLNDQKEIL